MVAKNLFLHWCSFCFFFPLVYGVQFRYIFTLFETKKTWNEASQICADQFGQLVKLGDVTNDDKIVKELQYLDASVWNNTIANGDGIWNGLHKVSLNDTMWVYEDCEQFGSTNLQTSVSPGSVTQCSMSNNQYVLYQVGCDEKHQFVCQRHIGDCWYEPFVGWGVSITNTNYTFTSDPAVCAVLCNSYPNSSYDCWAFQFFPSLSGGLCILEYHQSSTYYIDTSVWTSASDPSNTLYIRRCFEGLIDSNLYNTYVNEEIEPITDCLNKTYDGGPPAQEVCFCSADSQPPIPEPISNEEKADKLVKELTIDSSNTSAALRKLSSAEDNRPSAVGVGFVGIGLLTGVFGTLFMLDLGRFIRGVKALFKAQEDVQREI